MNSFLSTCSLTMLQPFRHWTLLLHKQLDWGLGMGYWRRHRTNRFMGKPRGTTYYTHSITGCRASVWCAHFWRKRKTERAEDIYTEEGMES